MVITGYGAFEVDKLIFKGTGERERNYLCSCLCYDLYYVYILIYVVALCL